ncbi:MAG: single-stranded DNA-binding protein [Candidatus Dojkabacteria bacterium]|nr:single-stranded DNA-binding protein [Candidatus Dojkabacteria bacterium]
MFGDINKVEIMGNMTRDPELRTTNSGTPVCSFSVATNRRYQQNEEWKEEVEFHNVVLWGQRAEFFTQRAKKGTRVYVEGRLQTRSWEGENGNKNYRTEIIALRVLLIDRYERGEGYEGSTVGNSENSASVPSSKPADNRKPKAKQPSDDEKIDPDDLPF